MDFKVVDTTITSQQIINAGGLAPVFDEISGSFPSTDSLIFSLVPGLPQPTQPSEATGTALGTGRFNIQTDFNIITDSPWFSMSLNRIDDIYKPQYWSSYIVPATGPTGATGMNGVLSIVADLENSGTYAVSFIAARQGDSSGADFITESLRIRAFEE